MKREVCPNCGGVLVAESRGWKCKGCGGFISLQSGKFYEYVEKPFMPPQTNADRVDNGVTFATDNHVGGKWIPVTERLPEEDGSYLCFSQYCGSGWCAVRGFAKDGRKKDEYDFQRRWKNVWYDYDSEYGYCVIDNITHWMPLPEPPKEGE